MTPSCPRSMQGTGRMPGATQTTTQTSALRLLHLRLLLYSVQLQASKLKHPAKSSQTLLQHSTTNSTELSHRSRPPSMQLLVDHHLRPLHSVVFQPLSHSEGSKYPRQVVNSQQAQAAWRSHFFKGDASHPTNSLTTVNLYLPLPLLLQHFNLQQRRQQPQ